MIFTFLIDFWDNPPVPKSMPKPKKQPAMPPDAGKQRGRHRGRVRMVKGVLCEKA